MSENVGSGKEPSNLSRNTPVESKRDSSVQVDIPIFRHEEINIDESLLIDLKELFIGSIISESAHTIVYEGWYKNMPVAVKEMQHDQASAINSESKEKFLREVTMLSRVKHENLVMFIGASMEPSMLIVMELMRGGSLKQYLWDMRPRCPDQQTSIIFALDIARVMECLHANGIIHRDLKPGNLLLTEDQKKLKLADFGLAREETVEEMMSSEVGTYRWMAPELFSTVPLRRGEKKHYDHKVDIYSFAIVLWELLTNCTPFKGMSGLQAAYSVSKKQRPSVDNLPKVLVPLLESCWAEDPTSRPEFSVIISILSDVLNTLYSANAIGQQNCELAADSPGTRHLMDKSGEVEGSKSRSSSPKFLRCFDKCFSKSTNLK